jgi:peptidoglycan/xylan/chitin deacetylase (PgdA/CDA1 family)
MKWLLCEICMQSIRQAGEDETSSRSGAGGRVGTFMLSLDCEGKWGLVDCLAPRHKQLFTTGHLDASYRKVTSLLRKYSIEATFAFTSAFTLTPAEFDRLRPALEDFRRIGADPWIGRALAEIEQDQGQGWFAPACFDAVCEPGGHEIGSHGFSHIPWREPYATPAVIDAELALCRSIPAFSGPSVATFVFPRNQVAHLELLAAHGFLGYRSASPPASRAAKLASEFNLLSRSEKWQPSGRTPLPLPAGFFLNWRHGLRRSVPAALTVSRWKHMLRHAGTHGGIVHGWTHPENFIDGDGMFQMFEEILRSVADEREAGRLQVLTNREFMSLNQPQFAARPSELSAS